MFSINRGYLSGQIDDSGRGKLSISFTPKEIFGQVSCPYEGNNVRCVMFGHNHGFNCADCEFACKFGVINVPVDYCRRVGKGCRDCGYSVDGYFPYGSPCPKCGSKVRVVAVIFDKNEIDKILQHLIKIGRAPPGFEKPEYDLPFAV